MSFVPEFQRAFVAMRYFLGARDEPLAAPLGDAAAVTHALEDKLGHPDRARRAEVLAAEVGLVVRALEARLYR
ncbi:MAG TPA: hypothetical protein VFZ53_03675 [Polyangiaceae bacterium]